MAHDADKRRWFKGTAALLGGSLLLPQLAACSRQTPQQNQAAADTHSPHSYPCHGKHQAGITTPQQRFGILAAFRCTASNRQELQAMLQTLSRRIEFLTQGGTLQDGNPQLPPAGSGILGSTLPPDGLTITVGVGASLFDARFDLAALKPKHLTEMPDFPNDKLQPQWSDGDLSLQICAFSPETCQNALRDIIKNLSRYLLVKWVIDGFLPKAPAGQAPRNLFGFRDGTSNPDVSQAEIANQVLWTGVAANALDEPEWTRHGSYQAIRLIRNFVEFWDRTPLQEQEAIFGRNKYSGAPLGKQHEHDAPEFSDHPQRNTPAPDSHIRLSNPRTAEFLRKHQLFRRPYNYSRGLSPSGQLDVGLVFVCYQANLSDGFVFVQNRLNHEPLEEYIQPFGGGYFFVLPGFSANGYLGQALFA